MINPLPSSLVLYNEIMDTLNELIESKETNELKKARVLSGLEEKAKKIKSHNLALGFCALGSIAAMRKNIKEMHRYHKAALQERPDPDFFFNYANSLAGCGLLEDAMTYAKVSYDLNPARSDVIDFLIKLSQDLDDTKSFLRYAAAWEKLTDEPHESYEQYLLYIQEQNEIADFCMLTSESSLAEVWNTPEEDEAWSHLQ